MGRGRQGLCVGGGGGRAADTSAWSLQGSGNATRLGLPEDGRGARGLESPVPGGQGPLAEPGLARPRSQGRDGGVRCQAERMTWLSLNAGGRGPLTSGREPNSRPSARQSGTLASACPKILLLSQLLKLGALGAGRPEGARAWEPDRLRAAFPSVLLVWTGYREGFLWKRGRDNGQFLSRKFVLTEREGALKYFNRSDAKEPKAIMKIEHLNATFQPAKIGHPHGLQVTYLKDNSTRNIFVYHEDGKEIVDWFNALRAARFHYLQVAFPGASDADLVPKLSRNYLQEGYMEKTGPKQTEGFRKRWFTMDDRRLMYFKDPLDAFARGEVFIGSRESGYTVLDGLPPSTQGHHWPHGITIVTPERRFLLACETESEQRAWMEALRTVVDRPMLPQEYAVEAHFKHKP
ncbi:arf-GAP with dual PH domain-containing protein 1 isoform X1 [Camelus ferus]|uniref:Arf-GAP with dual PH domain-containing protein 1 isoform X1 n=3 Tax=Camelus TaxID=9836 RepID=A0A8B8RCM7_CAMFR|nr:arf-GAP with dual PH domain-containing protein 1 isoform X1 [Camelus ferus]